MATFKIDQQKFRDASKLALKKQIIFIPILIIVVILATNVLPALLSDNISLSKVLPVPFIFILLLSVTSFGRNRQIDKHYLSQKEFHEPIELAVSDEGLQWITIRSTTNLKWNEIVKWKEGKGLILIYPSPHQIHFIDATALSETELHILRSNLPNK